jgi:ParB-like chromosome segregation protein Spo0J
MSTALEVTYLSTTSLKPHPKNPRVHTDKQVGQIAQSIEAFGFNVPILVDDRQNIVAGHGRLLAARKLGWNTDALIRRWQRRTKREAIHVESGESFGARRTSKMSQSTSTSETER